MFGLLYWADYHMQDLEVEIASIELKESKHVLKKDSVIMWIRARIVPKIRKDSSDHYY